MGGFFRLLALVLLGGIILYASLRLYLREGRRERLEEEWLARPAGSRTAHVEGGLAAYEARVRPWLLAICFGVPLAGLVAVALAANGW